MMNKNRNYIFKQDSNDDAIVRSIREFGLLYLNVKENNIDIVNEHTKLREEFRLNGSEPIDVIEEELEMVNWVDIKNNININVNDNNNEQLDSYKKCITKDDTHQQPQLQRKPEQHQLQHLQQQQQQQQQTYQINTTYFKKISPFDFKKRERRTRSISQSMIENHCVFCSNNNEPQEVVKSHSVRDVYGRVLCPKLRTYVCPICNSSGDSAHTVKYCPKKPVITMEDAIMLENLKYNEMLKKFEKFR